MAPTSLAQRVLFNPDLLSHIFAQLAHPPFAEYPPHIPEDAENKPGVEEQTLACAARVCRTFSDPALRALWASLPHLIPLLSLLTSFRIVGEPPDIAPDRQYRYTFAGEIPPAEWARFREYAAFVREVRYDETTVAYTDASIWVYLTHHLNGAALLPRMHTLGWLVANPYDTSLLAVASPALRKLDLYYGYALEQWGPLPRQDCSTDLLLRTVFKTAPHVRDLTLHLAEYKPLLPAVTTALKRLRRLNLDAGSDLDDAATVRILAGIETLDVLDNVPLKFPEVARLNVSGFPALKQLSVNGGARDAAMLLATITAPLSSFRVKTRQQPSKWHTAFPQMRAKLAALRSLELDIEVLDDPNEETWSIADLLQPLLPQPLRTLEILRVALTFATLRTRDTDLEALARACPQLVRLALDAHLIDGAAHPTVHALAAFARHCPRLESLVIPPLHAAADDAPLPAPPVQRVLRRLCFCSFCGLDVDAPDELGALLARVFPGLDTCASVEPSRGINHPDGEPGDPDPPKDPRDVDRKQWSAGKETWCRVLRALANARG